MLASRKSSLLCKQWTAISKRFYGGGRGWTERLRSDSHGFLTSRGGVFRAPANRTRVTPLQWVRAAFPQRHLHQRSQGHPRMEDRPFATASPAPFIHVDYSVARSNDHGYKIVCKSWKPDNEIRALVFLAHGFGEHCSVPNYDTLARALARLGCYVFAHDHVGHGRSDGPRAMTNSFDTYVDDILTHVDVCRNEFRDKPVYLIGHSMGGLLCVLTVQRKPQDFEGMVLLGPLLGIDKEEASTFKRTMARLLSWVIPSFPLGKLNPEKVSRDPAEVRRIAEDPLHYKGSVSAGWGAAALSALETMQANVRAVELPFLIQHGSADKICDPTDSQAFFEKASSKDKTIKIISGAYHSLLSEPDGVAEQVLKEVVEWFSARLPKKMLPH